MVISSVECGYGSRWKTSREGRESLPRSRGRGERVWGWRWGRGWELGVVSRVAVDIPDENGIVIAMCQLTTVVWGNDSVVLCTEVSSMQVLVLRCMAAPPNEAPAQAPNGS